MEHTFKAIDDDLNALGGGLAEMGDLAVQQVRAAVDAFVRHDTAAAILIAAADEKLDELDVDIERRAVRFIALRQPMADDLRRPIAAMKTAMQLERCGDLAKNIAKRVGRMEGQPAADQAKALGELGAMVAGRLAAVVAAFKVSDAAAAHEVWAKDTDIDEKHEEVLRGIVNCMASDPASVGVCTHLLFIAKNLERIGDHATNIAELVHYQITGEDLADRPKL
jgi:phosphate transport system protein